MQLIIVKHLKAFLKVAATLAVLGSEGERLSGLLRRGQTYEVRVAFSEAPPTDSSLWFASMGEAKWW
jgi:hypothetical protein